MASSLHLNLVGKSRRKQFALKLLAINQYCRWFQVRSIHWPGHNFTRHASSPTPTTACWCGLFVDLSKRNCIVLSAELCRLSQTACRCVNIKNSYFKQFFFLNFFDFVVLSVAWKFFNHVHCEDFSTNISLLSQHNKTMSARASISCMQMSCNTFEKFMW